MLVTNTLSVLTEEEKLLLPKINLPAKIYRDFRDLTYGLRKKAIKSELVNKYMLSVLPPCIAEIFVDAFLNPLDRKLSDDRTNVLKTYFSRLETSIVTSYIINHKPSSHKALEPLYNKEPAYLTDQYYYECPGGDAIPDRLHAVIANIPFWIRKIGNNQDKIKVLVPGSGPAQDVIGILVNNPDIREKTKFYCVDEEPSAIKLGIKMAQKAGVASNIEYIENDLMKLDYNDIDLALLVGIICPLPNNVSSKVVGKVASYCRTGGIVAVSAALQKFLIEDPVTTFIMDFIGWKLCYKTDVDLEEILKKSGLVWLDYFQDPKYQYHKIVLAVKT